MAPIVPTHMIQMHYVYESLVCRKPGFREARLSETGLPRITLLGFSVNKEVIPKTERSPPTSDYCSGPNGSPSASASAPKILTAGSAQGMSSCGASGIVGLSGGQSPEGMSLLTSTTTVASSSGW